MSATAATFDTVPHPAVIAPVVAPSKVTVGVPTKAVVPTPLPLDITPFISHPAISVVFAELWADINTQNV